MRKDQARGAEELVLGGDLRVGRLGFGAMRLCGPGVWGEPDDPENARRVLRRAVELGVDFIDTADAYGPEVSERQISSALHPYPVNLVIATKGGYTRQGPGRWRTNGRPKHLREACEGSLRRLKLDKIDLYQLHRPDRRIPFERSMETLARLREEGKVRHVGLSNVTAEELERAARVVPIASVQNRYNLNDRRSEGVLRACERAGITFIPWLPLGTGRLARPGGVLAGAASRHGATVPQVALAWLLAKSPAMLPIPGTSSVEHLEQNLAAAKLRLTDEEVVSLTSLKP
ncbi:oxidoreductase [Rubrobacter tropicus]|uniref:Oxidoreductase n=1 Tax=Rubrobacter tropicus TaxID=2653851 RepID=A0A6G8QAS8_9ACTN|nr:aldo/keto reductase [Rubrobacter tropicus]QIN83532.1 oxidoreductase [Rubrobacter tropicus]